MLNVSKFSKSTKDYIQYLLDNNIINSIINNKIKFNNIIELLQIEDQYIIEYIDKYNDINITINTVNNNHILNNIKYYANSPWVSYKDVMNKLPNMNINYIIKWTTINNNSINKIIIKSSSFPFILKRIKKIILMIEYLKFKVNKKAGITIYLLLTNLKKYLTQDTINIDNVNSGYCDIKNNIIFIWRYEEVEKVLFHEIMHYLNFSNHLKDFEIDIKINKSTLIIDGPLSLHEAIADFWGIFYHLIYLKLNIGINYKYLLKIEYFFIRNQAMQMFDYFKLNQNQNKNMIKIKQKTPAFTYYIVKYLLFNFFLKNKHILFYLNKNEQEDNLFTIYYNKIFKKIFSNIKFYNFININCNRMTILQLK
jgi:hypothetical protein